MEEVTLTTTNPVASKGTAGLETQVGNQPTTVSGAAAASGGLGAGQFIDTDIDEELFKFSSDDTPLMNLMLKAKKVSVTSPEVQHYSIDEPTAMVSVVSVSNQVITIANADKLKVHAYDVLTCIGVLGYEGYDANGTSAASTSTTLKLSTKPLQLFVTAVNSDNTFTVKAINGVKTAATDEYGDLPTVNTLKVSGGSNNTNIIDGSTKLILLGNALYETQKKVDPDLVLPQPETIYLQKRGMNQIVSDYFDSQKKRIPYTKATIAEAAIRNFKAKGNRTLWISQPAKFRVKAMETGDMQYVYNTTGVRWQFKREVEHTGKWTYEEFISLAKLFYTGEDVPKSCLVLCGKNFLESIQCIDWTGHNEVRVDVKTNPSLGWQVTAITTVFGEFQFKREPTLDRMGYENCAAFIGEDRLVHYQRKAETSFNEKVEGEEATRSGILVWDALCLKGSCHIWVDGKGGETAPEATEFILWSSTTAPTGSELKNGAVYCFAKDVASINAKAGEMYKYSSASGGTWTRYNGNIAAN